MQKLLAWLLTENSTYMLKVSRVKGNEWSCYVDSDHAGDRIYGDKLSRTGIMIFIFLLNGMPVHWRSNKQPTTAQSSAAAEIIALSQCCQDIRLRYWIAE